jgi:hypothetical protein
VLVFPNPAKDNVTLLLPSTLINKKIFVTITNRAGQIIKRYSDIPTIKILILIVLA